MDKKGSLVLDILVSGKMCEDLDVLWSWSERKRGWPLLTVKTEVNRDLKIKNERALSLVLTKVHPR